MAELGRALERLDEFWQTHQIDEDQQADLNIAVEEILSNVIRHSGATEPIALIVDVDDAQVRIEIQDSGRPFDPLAHPMPDPNAPLEQRRAGGLGIFMVVKMMNEVSYQRRNGRNCFSMARRRT
jgi:anti-sigma regulatory factor (Ser/Thr protein kinase)